MSMVLMKLANIQAEVEAIAKERENTTQHYNFRGVEDVLNMIHGLLAKHRVLVSTRLMGDGQMEERKSKTGSALITRVYKYEFDFVAEDGSVHTVGPIPGEGMDSGDKASNKTIANAYKYCIFFTFSIPTQDLVTEPDSESPGGNGGEIKKSTKSSTKPASDGDLRKQIEEILANPVFQTDDKPKKEVAGAMVSLKNIKEKKSLENFKKLWEKKLADQPVTPEAEAVQGEFDGASEAFDNS